MCVCVDIPIGWSNYYLVHIKWFMFCTRTVCVCLGIPIGWSNYLVHIKWFMFCTVYTAGEKTRKPIIERQYRQDQSLSWSSQSSCLFTCLFYSSLERKISRDGPSNTLTVQYMHVPQCNVIKHRKLKKCDSYSTWVTWYSGSPLAHTCGSKMSHRPCKLGKNIFSEFVSHILLFLKNNA